VASLGDAVRRGLYRFVVDQARPVGRDEAAGAVGVSRALAAYHLDRLAGEGLLDIRFERLGTRRGPGAGRPAKLYQRSRRQFAVQLPPRNYELAARLLAHAIDAAPKSDVRRTLGESARELGFEVGVHASADFEAVATPKGQRERLLATMCQCGYEPVDVDGSIRLRNCPFDALAQEHRDLVCGMNLALIEGFLAAVGCSELEPVLEPRPGECCVVVRPTAA
jgi:predicted ArsR family transcriptional regulator